MRQIWKQPGCESVRFAYLLCLLGALFALFLVRPATSDAFIYWASSVEQLPVGEHPEITEGFSRANLDGTGPDFAQANLGENARALAVDGSHVYWLSASGALARSALDGSGVERDFLPGLLTSAEREQIPSGIVVAGSYIYWSFSASGTIRRARLDGSEVNRSFITLKQGAVEGLAAEGSYLYWTSTVNPNHPALVEEESGGVVGRATLEGTEVNEVFVEGFNVYCSFCSPYQRYQPLQITSIAANEGYLYVSISEAPFGEGNNQAVYPAAIARISRSGGKPVLNFMTGFRAHAGGDQRRPIAATNSAVYWLEPEAGQTIGRVDADGTHPHPEFICQNEAAEHEWGLVDYVTLAINSEYSASTQHSSAACLLREFVPAFYLDSQESYHPDSAAQIVDIWGDNALGFHECEEEGGEPYTNSLNYGEGEHLYANPCMNIGREYGLNLGTLGSTYAFGGSASNTDTLDERDGHYVEDAQASEGSWHNPPILNRVYGHIQEAPSGQLWLEYWVFYYYNDSSFLGTSIGTHEGDWEMLEIALDQADEPERVVFAQHESASTCEPNEVEWQPTTPRGPISFVALGTHADYPFPGAWEDPSGVPEATDHADGEGAHVLPSLEELDYGTPSWVNWPGHWGGTEPGIIPGEAWSPSGPAQHGQWSTPEALAESAAECGERLESGLPLARGVAPAQTASGKIGWPRTEGGETEGPMLETARYIDGKLRVHYRFARRGSGHMVMSIVPTGGPGRPMSWTVASPKLRGEAVAPFIFRSKPKGKLLASRFAPNGARSEISEVPIE